MVLIIELIATHQQNRPSGLLRGRAAPSPSASKVGGTVTTNRIGSVACGGAVLPTTPVN